MNFFRVKYVWTILNEHHYVIVLTSQSLCYIFSIIKFLRVMILFLTMNIKYAHNFKVV